MEILGVGPLEIILVIVLALVVLGPADMVVTARKIGIWVRKMVRSDLWREIMDTSREIRQIPTTLIRDSGLEETMNEIKDTGRMVQSEVSQATQAVSAEMQQANQDLSAEVSAAAQDAQVEPVPAGAADVPVEVSLTAAREVGEAVEVSLTAQPEPDAVSAEPELAPQAWEEAQGNQPHPFSPGEYPQVYPVQNDEKKP